MYPPERTTPPSGDVVSPEEVMVHARVDADEDLPLVASLVQAATTYLDGYHGILDGYCLLTQTWRVRADRLDRIMRLPLKPVTSITSISITDSAGATSVVASTNYSLQRDALGWFVRFADGYALPSDLAETQAVSIVFVAGFGSAASSVPPDIRLAIRMLAAHWYNNREAAGSSLSELPFGVAALLTNYRRHLY